jgi:hypothetical protein
MAGRVDAVFVDLVFLLECRQNGVEEFQVAVAMVSRIVLPAGTLTFGIRQPSRRRDSLHVDHDRLRP